jgi:hypothetical protein
MWYWFCYCRYATENYGKGETENQVANLAMETECNPAFSALSILTAAQVAAGAKAFKAYKAASESRASGNGKGSRRKGNQANLAGSSSPNAGEVSSSPQTTSKTDRQSPAEVAKSLRERRKQALLVQLALEKIVESEGAKASPAGTELNPTVADCMAAYRIELGLDP